MDKEQNILWIKVKTTYQTVLHCSLLACIWLLSHHVHAVGTTSAIEPEVAVYKPQYDTEGFNNLLDVADRKLSAHSR